MRFSTVLGAFGIVSLSAAGSGVSPDFLNEFPANLSKRRGIAFNRPEYVKLFNFQGSYVKWCYNWDSADVNTGTMNEFVPMLHSNNPIHTGTWLERIHHSAEIWKEMPTHIMGFNEPDVCANGSGGSCISVDVAVKAWKQLMEPTKKYKELMYLGSPAITNSDSAGEGLTWLADFMGKCDDCKIDFICIHWYGEATDVQYFKDHIEATRKLAGGRPIWVTEFYAKGDENDVKKFFEQILPWMDATDDIHRYAYFMAAPGLLINSDGTDMSNIGRLFNFNPSGPSSSPGPPSPPAKPSKRAGDVGVEKGNKPKSELSGAVAELTGAFEKSTPKRRDSAELKILPPNCMCCWYLRCRMCPQCRVGNDKYDAPTQAKASKRKTDPPVDDSVIPKIARQDELEVKGCRFVLWGWICDTTFDASALSPATRHSLESQGCRFVLWGWICDKRITNDELPTIDASLVSKDTQDSLESQGCRFVIWGWICDKTFRIEASMLSRQSREELESKGCFFVSHGWACSKLGASKEQKHRHPLPRTRSRGATLETQGVQVSR